MKEYGMQVFCRIGVIPTEVECSWGLGETVNKIR